MIKGISYIGEYNRLVETLEVLEGACLSLEQSKLHSNRIRKMKDIMRQHFRELEKRSRFGYRR